MKVDKNIVSAVVISAVIHAVFFMLASGIKVSKKHIDKIKPRKFFHIKTLKSDVPERKVVKARKIDQPMESLKFEGPLVMDKGRARASKSEKMVQKRDLGHIEVQTKQLVKTSAQVKFDAYLQEKKDEGLVQKVRRVTRKNLLKVVAKFGNNTFATPKDIFNEEDISEDFLDKMPGLTPKLISRPEDVSPHSQSAFFSQGPTSVIQKKKEIKDLKQYLNHELTVYHDPQDGEKYYKLSIHAGEKAYELPAIPKEIVFLVDCSISTQPERLEEFKEGMMYSLNHLNPEDSFNIIAFKKSIYHFRAESVKPDPATKAEALRFVAQLTAGEKTDAYNAFYNSIATKNIKNPSYMLFLSDGRPTKGVTDPKKLINDISALNNGRIAIFSFSGGMRVNRYLLDFIAYKNRGWAEYSYRTNLIGATLSNMYEKIKDPLLLSLRYYANGLDNQNIFPKILPDFFRNTEFTFYGKYTEPTDFSLQLLGDLNGNVNEFFIKGSLKKAAQGDEEIARGWAFNKIYHLIGLLNSGEDNKKLVGEIKFLSDKFKIKTPYARRVFGK